MLVDSPADKMGVVGVKVALDGNLYIRLQLLEGQKIGVGFALPHESDNLHQAGKRGSLAGKGNDAPCLPGADSCLCRREKLGEFVLL